MVEEEEWRLPERKGEKGENRFFIYLKKLIKITLLVIPKKS